MSSLTISGTPNGASAAFSAAAVSSHWRFFQVGAAADEGVAEALEEIARATRAGEMPAFLSKEDQ